MCVINYSALLDPFYIHADNFHRHLRNHLASRYHVSIYRSIYWRIIEVRAAPMRCNIDDTLAARGTTTPWDEENARRGRKREKEKDTRGQVRRGNVDDIVQEGTITYSENRPNCTTEELWIAAQPRCRCEKRKRETREGIRNPFSCPSTPDYIFHRPIKEAVGKKGKKSERG